MVETCYFRGVRKGADGERCYRRAGLLGGEEALLRRARRTGAARRGDKTPAEGVSFEAYCASTVDPASGLVTHSLAEEMGGAKEAAIFFDRLYFEYGMDQFREMAQSRRPVVLLSESVDGRLRTPRATGSYSDRSGCLTR